MRHSYVGDLIPFTLLQLLFSITDTNFISWYQERIKSNQANRFLRNNNQNMFSKNFLAKLEFQGILPFLNKENSAAILKF